MAILQWGYYSSDITEGYYSRDISVEVLQCSGKVTFDMIEWVYYIADITVGILYLGDYRGYITVGILWWGYYSRMLQWGY